MKGRIFLISSIVFSSQLSSFCYAQASNFFEPLQTPLIDDLRPKPNIMLMMDTSNVGVQTKLSLTTDERDFFEDELREMGLQNQNSISKTDAISVAILKILKTYQHVAHFGLSRTDIASPYAYITEGNAFYEKEKTIDVNPIIVPIYNPTNANSIGNYQQIDQDEKQHFNNLKNAIINFQKDYSSSQDSRAWQYSISEVSKYFWGSRYYLDNTNSNYLAHIPSQIANQVLPLNIQTNQVGEKRIQYESYPDPIKYICQQSNIIYFPVDISKTYDDTKQYDRAMNIPMTAQQYTIEDKYSNKVYKTTPNDTMDILYKAPSDASIILGQVLRHYLSSGNIYDSRKLEYCNKFSGSFGIMKSILSANPTLADAAGNLWKHWSGTQCSNGQGTYNPSDINIGAIYTGPAFTVNQQIEWNEKNHIGQDELQKFIDFFTRGYGEIDGNTASGTVNNVPFASQSNAVYLRANRNNETTLMSIFDRTKEYFDRKIISHKTNGRFMFDQHVPDTVQTGRAYITYSTSYTEQFWTSEIRAYDPRKPNKSGYASKSVFGNVNYDPTWSTSDTMTYDQGEFFTSAQGKKTELNLLITGNQLNWLKGDLSLDPYRYRVRNNILGDIVNSSIVYTAKDHFYINLDLVGANREQYINFMNIKNDNFENNLLIAGSNDGFLNFIVAGRNSKGHQGQDLTGMRKAAYFIPFFKDDIKNIMEPLPSYAGEFQHKFRVDGQINLFDAIVNDGFKTSGIAGMGAGYKGIVGFELFSIDSKNVVDNKGEIEPLFEIDTTMNGFKNLGYTYSGFAFFNDFSLNTGGRSIAIFGNGPGNTQNVSSLFFINAITGELLGELDLSPYSGKGGAFTPALVLSKADEGQNLDIIYVGDYSGKLFKIDFRDTAGAWRDRIPKAEVTLLFDAGNSNFTKPISVQPYVQYNPKTKKNWIFFGTGMLATIKQKENTSEQAFYALEDKDEKDPEKREIKLSSLNRLTGTQVSNKSRYPGLVSSQISSESILEVRGGKPLSSDQNGWYLPLKSNNTDIVPKSFSSDYNKNPSMNVIYPAAMVMNNKIVFSAREIISSNVHNVCASDIVQSPLYSLQMYTGAAALTGNINYQGDSLSGLTIVNQGLLAPFQSFGTLTKDSYVGNIASGYNLSLTPEERERLDDVKTLSTNNINNSNSSNIGGRRNEKNNLDYSIYRFYPTMNTTYDNATQKYNTREKFEYIPYSSIFGEDGSAERYPIGSFIEEPPAQLTPKRIHVKKKYQF